MGESLNRKDTKIIRATPETHKRLTKQGRKGETYNDIIIRLLEEPQFVEKAKPILEKAKRVMERHEKVGSNWAEVEESFRELLALVDDFLEELKRR